jgi:hypothetical protein
MLRFAQHDSSRLACFTYLGNVALATYSTEWVMRDMGGVELSTFDSRLSRLGNQACCARRLRASCRRARTSSGKGKSLPSQ